MNILLWIIQILLALWNIIGALYTASNYTALANTWALQTLTQPFWLILSVLQILFSLGLILPSKKFPKLVSTSAIGIAVISLLGISLYTSYSGLGSLWGIIPALLAIFVAFKRY